MKITTPNSEIVFTENISQNIKKVLDNGSFDKCYILVDENTKNYCLQLVTSMLTSDDYILIESQSGEANKSIESVQKIWDVLNTSGATRKSLFINIGGGLVCDMGGFSASTFKRGLTFINIPTTLLSQVDASVGGKTGVNFNELKNEIGIFNNPINVYINPSFIITLDYLEKLSGVGEMLKHALIFDKDHWIDLKQWVESGMDFNNMSTLLKLIHRSVEIKTYFVEKDPKEKNIRKALNLGHTVAHAIESLSFRTNKHISHGHAVALGVICESHIALQNCLISKSEYFEIKELISKIYPKYLLMDKDISEYIKLMYHDKKNEDSRINFTLLKGIGDFSIDNYVSEEIIYNAMKEIITE